MFIGLPRRGNEKGNDGSSFARLGVLTFDEIGRQLPARVSTSGSAWVYLASVICAAPG